MRISYLDLPGSDVHQLWFSGGRWAYAAVCPPGFTDHILQIIDVDDPARPRLAGRWWLPGMHRALGETPSWDQGCRRFALHRTVVDEDTAYACWRDGGLTLIDITDRNAPQLISHRTWAPPYGGDTHMALPLRNRDLLVVADEATADPPGSDAQFVWLFDIADPNNPISISTLPTPDEQSYPTKGGRFGPRALHDNRPGSLVSDELVFATYQNAGIRVFDIRNPYRPNPVGALVPGPPTRLIDPHRSRSRVIQTADIHVRPDGVTFCTDDNAGLISAQYQG
ncbi:LVIVD repeat-containing protein [Nocardia sp. NPDC004722]